MKLCVHCNTGFEISDEDRLFLDFLSPVIGGKRFPLPEPTLCPDCREQRRLAQANQLHLYKRKCGFSGKDIISNYHPSSPFKVYDQEVWYTDSWDALEFGREYDFRRPFFDQYRDLSYAVPRPSLHRGFQYDENAAYTNYAGKNKNCYLIFDSDEDWDSYFSYSLNNSKNCMDTFRVEKSELCYECIDSLNLYHAAYVQDSENCADSYFLKSCIGCRNCLYSVNLRNKTYHIWNKPASKEAYEEEVKKLESYSYIHEMENKFREFARGFPQKYLHGTHNENVFGEYVNHSKNSFSSFDSRHLWDTRYIFQAFNPLKNSMDCQECGDGEGLYECAFSGYNAFNLYFSVHCLGETSNSFYSNHCPHSSNLFGCIGLRHKKYCILNKQYSEKEYEELVPRIIEHMMSTGEWGEFFPMELSSFAYNETLAEEYFPLSKEEILKRGLKWQDDQEPDLSGVTKKIDARRLPENISDIPDDILNWAIECEESGKLFRIQKAELEFYRKMNLPIPRFHFLVRHEKRRIMRNPRKLWSRTCMKCEKDIVTSYSPERPEKVYCEECYLHAVG